MSKEGTPRGDSTCGRFEPKDPDYIDKDCSKKPNAEIANKTTLSFKKFAIYTKERGKSWGGGI